MQVKNKASAHARTHTDR